MTLLDIEWLTIALPIICLALLALEQGFFYFAYVFWNPPAVGGLHVANVALLFGYGFWVGSVFMENPADFKSICLFAGLFVLGVYFIAKVPSAVIHWKISNFACYYFVIIATDVILIATLIATSLKLAGNCNVKAATICVLVCSIVAIPPIFLGIMKCLPKCLGIPTLKFGSFRSDNLPEGNGKSVNVVLLTGQSNASGVCRVPYLKKKNPTDFPMYERGFSNVWISYFNDNGSMNSHGFVNVKTGQGGTDYTFGPELGLGETLSKKIPNEPTFIIKHAWGGTNLYAEWLSPTSAAEEGVKTGMLYKAFIKYTKEALAHLEDKGYKPHIVANCWMQGESDSTGKPCELYQKHTVNLVNDTINDFKDYITAPKMLFVDAGISDSKLDNGKYIWPGYVKINEQKQAATKIINSRFLDTIAAGLTCDTEPTGEFKDPKTVDHAHYDALSGIKLGQMFGDAVVEHIKKK